MRSQDNPRVITKVLKFDQFDPPPPLPPPLPPPQPPHTKKIWLRACSVLCIRADISTYKMGCQADDYTWPLNPPDVYL